LIAIIYIKM